MPDKKNNQGLFSKITSILAYKPPRRNTFVLPELKDEDSYRVTPEDRAEMDYGETGGGREAGSDRGKTNKKPVRAREWSKVKGGKANGGKKDEPESISPDLDVSLAVIKRELHVPQNLDVVIREFKLAREIDAFIVFIDGMADRNTINDFILRQLMSPVPFENYRGGCRMEYISGNVLTVNQTARLEQYKDVIIQVLMGVTAIFVDGCDTCLAVETRGFEKRGIEKPSTEAVVRGSQEAFTENLKTNVTQLRRIIKNKDLIHETVIAGQETNSLISILYMRGMANPALVREVKRRVKSIKTDMILGSGMIEQLIEDNTWMIIPQVLATERPDRTASHLMEGKVAIITEGSPFSIVVPVTFHSLMQSPEDYFLRWQFGTAARLVRTMALFIAMFLPALYIAMTNYHQEMIPTDLLISIARAREVVPFPSIVEVLLMEISFELIREAGIRVPGLIGTTLGIIGALILGQAAVAANIVSPILIIIVAVTGLGNFAIPNYSLAYGVRLLRFIFIILGGLLGFFGISVGMVMAAAAALSMKSFGVPFLSPSWPKTTVLDQMIRCPIWLDEERPDAVNPLNRRRQPEIARGWTREEPPKGKRE
ncbi:MAG: spore germination protein [Desulfatirhabdiaceae bacterium]